MAAARGDLAGARHWYDELVGGQVMGRVTVPIEAWALGELGQLLLRQGPGALEVSVVNYIRASKTVHRIELNMCLSVAWQVEHQLPRNR